MTTKEKIKDAVERCDWIGVLNVCEADERALGYLIDLAIKQYGTLKHIENVLKGAHE